MVIDYEKFEKIIFKNIQNADDLRSFFKGYNEIILTEGDSYNRTLKTSFMIINEDIPFRYLHAEKYEIPETVIGDYESGKINIKNNSLYDIYPCVYSDVIKDNTIAYANSENITDEITKILEQTDSEGKDLSIFLITYCGLDFANSENVAKEFISINNKLPKMVDSERIIIYSALLNYTAKEINSAKNYKAFLLSLISKYFKKYDATFTHKMHKIPDNWDRVAKIFKDFLKELSRRTINY